MPPAKRTSGTSAHADARLAQWLRHLLTALHCSIFTLSSLGCGDLEPSCGGGRFLGVLDVLVGGILLPLFLIWVVHKFSN